MTHGKAKIALSLLGHWSHERGRLRPITTSVNFRMLNLWTTGWGAKGWGGGPKGGAPKGGAQNFAFFPSPATMFYLSAYLKMSGFTPN